MPNFEDRAQGENDGADTAASDWAIFRHLYHTLNPAGVPRVQSAGIRPRLLILRCRLGGVSGTSLLLFDRWAARLFCYFRGLLALPPPRLLAISSRAEDPNADLARAGWISALLLEWQRKQCSHPAQGR